MRDTEHWALEVASFRYRLIADAAEADGPGVRRAIEHAAARPYVHPSGQTIRLSERTLWRWLKSYQRGGLHALKPPRRKDAGTLRALSTETLERAVALRRENDERPTKTVIDILQRLKVVCAGALKRSTLDRHLDHLGASRRQLHRLGVKTFKKILTTAPCELVIADFHHGPYVRVPDEERARRALLLAFIDHFSRYILEARYYLHEDFAVLRCGFRHLLMVYGPFRRLYIDNGPSFQSARFHAACQNEALHIEVVHSKAYTSEGRGVCERFNRTVKEQFESEVRRREELLTLDELNAGWEAWVAERYHHDVHSEIGAAPFARFTMHAELRPAPDLACLDELLRLRKSARVHPKWSIVEVGGMRYLVTPSLRARRVQVLYDPLDPAYVLIEFDGRLVERAYPQKAGDTPPQLDPSPTPTTATDYLALLRRDYEARTQAELAAVNLRRRPVRPELSFRELQTLLTAARGKALAGAEHTELGACFRKLRPLDPDTTRQAVEAAQRRFGIGCHLRTYLEVVETALVRQRAKHGKGEKS